MSKLEIQGRMAEGLFAGFMAFMLVMAISTPFVVGLSIRTIVAAGCGVIGLSGVLLSCAQK